MTHHQPRRRQLFNLGEVVVADYSCADDQPGPVATCDGPVDNGAADRHRHAGRPHVHRDRHRRRRQRTTVTHTYAVARADPTVGCRLGAAGHGRRRRLQPTGAGQGRHRPPPEAAPSPSSSPSRTTAPSPRPSGYGASRRRTNYTDRLPTGGADITSRCVTGTYPTRCSRRGRADPHDQGRRDGRPGAPARQPGRPPGHLVSTSDPLVKDVVALHRPPALRTDLRRTP